jgi:hypothetical protein
LAFSEVIVDLFSITAFIRKSRRERNLDRGISISSAYAKILPSSTQKGGSLVGAHGPSKFD